MKIVFIIKKLSISDPMGIMYLSASLKKAGHETDLICFAKENLFERLRELKPDVVAYSITTGMHQELISINKEIKKRLKIYSVFGGPHPTFYPEMIKEEGVDAICIGEGEEAFVEFINKLSSGKRVDNVKNFWVKNFKTGKIIKNPPRKLIENLDSLPFADRELIYKKDSFFKELEIKRFMTGRGCPFRCTYCFNRQYNALYRNKGKIVRHRSVDNVIKEIEEIRNKYPLGSIKFIDDTFNINPGWLKEFCEKYKEKINLPFICNIRADLVTSEMAHQLKNANCIVVYIGIETGNEKVRKEILERNMSNEQILNACKLLRKNRIKIVSQNMLGLPGEGIEKSFETILFNSKCKVNFPGFSIFQPYPDTALTDYAIKNGFFDGNFDNSNPDYLRKSPLNLGKMEKRQLENLNKFSSLLARFAILTPLVRFLIKFPENKAYNLVYSLSYGMSLWNVYSAAFGSNLKLIKSAKRLLEYTF